MIKNMVIEGCNIREVLGECLDTLTVKNMVFGSREDIEKFIEYLEEIKPALRPLNMK